MTVDLDEGAGIGAWDLRAARHAVTAVLRRRPEAYHARLLAEGGRVGSEGPDSIHDHLRAREAGLAEYLQYDGYERRSALVRCLPVAATAATWAAGGGPDLGDPAAPAAVTALADGRLETHSEVRLDGHEVRLTKAVSLGGGRLDPWLGVELGVENRSPAGLRVRLGLEWAMTMLGGGGNPQAWWELGGSRTAHDAAGSGTRVSRLGQGNDWLGVIIATAVEPAADAWWAPIETVSNSEGGVERVYQGSALLLSWVVDVAPGATWRATVQHAARIASERVLEG